MRTLGTIKRIAFSIIAMLLALTCLFSCTTDLSGGSGDRNNSEEGDAGEGTGNSDSTKKRVLLVSIDGMRSDALLASEHAEYLTSTAICYPSATTVMPSVTLPCHMSMHHGVSPEMHGVTTNEYTPSDNLALGLAETLSANGKKCAFFYNWGPLGNVISDSALVKEEYIAGEELGWHEANGALVAAAEEYLAINEVDFTFLYLGCLDEMGHRYGWLSEEYFDALNSSLAAVIAIASSLPDDYTVIITTDHGGIDYGHGGSLDEEMTIPIFILDKSETAGAPREGGSILDIAPTVADILGVAPDTAWTGAPLK